MFLDKHFQSTYLIYSTYNLRTKIFCSQNILKHPSVNSIILTKREFQIVQFFIKLNVQIYHKTNLGQSAAPEEENILLLFYSFWIVEY